MDDKQIIADAQSAEAVKAAAGAQEAIEKARAAQMEAAVNQAVEKLLTGGVADAIQRSVNGKVDGMRKALDEHNITHENDMRRMMPIIEAFEKAQQDLETAKKGGRFILWFAATVTAVGGAYLVVRMIFFNH